MVAPAESAEVRLRGRDADLESAQRIWRWLLLSAMGLLIVETWLAGRKAVIAKEAA